jgi:uncharacterized membrane protein
MPFCKNCGSQVDGPFCAKCGTPQAAAPPPAQAAYTPPPPQPPPAQTYSQPGYGAPAQPAPAADAMADNVAGMLCYAPFVGWIIAIVMLVVAPYNQKKFVRFCAFQSIFLVVAWFAFWIVIHICSLIVFAVMPWGLHLVVAMLIGLLVWALLLGMLALLIFLMIKANQNQKVPLPFIGALAEKQA